MVGEVPLEIANPIDKKANKIGNKKKNESLKKNVTNFNKNNDTLLKKNSWKMIYFGNLYSILRVEKQVMR